MELDANHCTERQLSELKADIKTRVADAARDILTPSTFAQESRLAVYTDRNQSTYARAKIDAIMYEDDIFKLLRQVYGSHGKQRMGEIINTQPFDAYEMLQVLIHAAISNWVLEGTYTQLPRFLEEKSEIRKIYDGIMNDSKPTPRAERLLTCQY